MYISPFLSASFYAVFVELQSANFNITFHFSDTHFPISQMRRRRWLRLWLRLRLQLERSARKRVQSVTNNNKSNWFMAAQRENEALLTTGSQAAWVRERASGRANVRSWKRAHELVCCWRLKAAIGLETSHTNKMYKRNELNTSKMHQVYSFWN